MATPASEVNKFRNKAQATVDGMRDLGELIAIVEDHGATDQERATFFNPAFGAEAENQDITFSEFAAGLVALRAMQAAWNTNKYAIAKLLK